jgi:hypothetical protein
MWQCVKCREKHDDSFDTCWNCGTTEAGVADPSFRKVGNDESDANANSKSEATKTSKFPLTCPLCDQGLDFVGTKNFHEGTRWGVLGDLAELFVNKERFDIYCCPRCGRVEFFVDGIGEEFRPQ